MGRATVQRRRYCERLKTRWNKSSARETCDMSGGWRFHSLRKKVLWNVTCRTHRLHRLAKRAISHSRPQVYQRRTFHLSKMVVLRRTLSSQKYKRILEEMHPSGLSSSQPLGPGRLFSVHFSQCDFDGNTSVWDSVSNKLKLILNNLQSSSVNIIELTCIYYKEKSG